jgi:hypothetical protein
MRKILEDSEFDSDFSRKWRHGARATSDVMTTSEFCCEGDPSSACGTFSPLRRGEGYLFTFLARIINR